jgi:glycosyltransferase involved in cell wall biosynthesis
MVHPEKVILIGPAHPLRGGLATYNERLIREYRSMGCDASIFTFSLQYPSILFPGKTQYSSEPPPEDIPIRIRVNSVQPLNWISVGRELKRLRPDLVIVKYWIPFMAPCFGTICRILRKNRHSRVISVVDNIIPHEQRPGDHFLSSFWVKSVDGFVAMSHAVMHDLQMFDKIKPKAYCPHPLYDNFGEKMEKAEAKRSLGLDQNVPVILFFGFIRDYKGLDLLLEAMATEGLKKLPAKLLIAGEFYCDPVPYQKIIEKHQLADRIIFHNDFIPDSKVRNYFSAADLVVQPYKNATQSGVSQIAYHFDKPMVITDVGGLAEFVPDGRVGFVVPPEPSAISTAIIRFYKENRESEFTFNASIEKQKYTWQRMVETINTTFVSSCGYQE